MINEWVRQEIIKLKAQLPPNNILRHARQKVKYNLCKIFPTSRHQYSLMQTEFSHLKMEHEIFKFPFSAPLVRVKCLRREVLNA